MDLYCTRPGCPKPLNHFSDLDSAEVLKRVPQKFCTACGMPLILDGRYLPLKLLGKGGFGAAFLARDRRLPGMRECVVKLFQPEGNLTNTQLEVAQRKFEEEAEALEDLGNTHPLIPDLFAFFELTVPSLQPGKQDKLFYLVQEFIDGQTLEEILIDQGPFSPATVLDMLEEILPVLTFVHDRGAIHRDIKPSNIMQHRNGHYFLLDFGAVRQATKGNTKSTGIYSLGFAPPEQVAGNDVYPCTDLYALAVTCIMLMTGKQPNELFDSFRNTWVWRSQVPQVSDAFAKILDRLLLPTADRRYQSAAEVLAALKAVRTPVKSFRAPRATGSASGRSAATYPPKSTQSTGSLQPSGPNAPNPPVGQTPATNLQGGQPAGTPAGPPMRQRRLAAIAPFSTLELLGNAGFTGFESALVAIVCFSLPLPTLASAGLWLLVSAGLVFAQSRRLIERVDLLIIVVATLGLMVFFPGLRQGIGVWATANPVLTLVFIAGMVGLAAIAATALFRLIYRILANFF